MKKVVLLLTLVLGTLVSNAQLSVSSSENRGIIGDVRGIALSYVAYKNADTLFVLTYKNAKYQYIDDYKSLAFNSGPKAGNVLNGVYELFNASFEKGEDYSQKITLGDNELILGKVRNSLMVYTTKGYFLINQSDLKKLFKK